MAFNPTVSGISGASDVALNNKANGEVLKYDSTLDKWRNMADATGGTTTHTHAAADITSGTFSLDRMPAGYRHTVKESGGTYVRGTTRTDITVVFVGASDPGSVALDGDFWDMVA